MEKSVSAKMQKGFLVFIVVGFFLSALTLLQESNQETSPLTTKVQVSRPQSADASEKIVEPEPSRPISTQWRSCGAHLSRKIKAVEVSDRSFDKLLKAFHVSNDVTLSLVHRGSLKKLNVHSARHLISTSRDVRERFRRFTRNVHVQHKWIELGSNVLVLYPDNTVLTADSQTCSVRSVHLSFGNNELHPEIRDDVVGNNLLVQQDKGKKKKKRRPPPPRPRPHGFSHHVCVNARGGFARFRVPYSGEISGMTLYHRNGQVYHCGARNKHCYGKFGGGGNRMGIIVTRSNNRIMYPTRGTPGFHGRNHLGFYRMNGHNRMSNTLSFGGPSNRVRAGEQLRFYFAEAYTRRTTGDNGGRTCFYVYLFYKRTPGNSVCVNGRSGYATMHVPRSGVVTGMELHHVWGEIYHCGHRNRACFGKFGGAHDKIGIIVTDDRRRVMYPARGTGGLVGGIDRRGFYRLNKFGRYSNRVALINPYHRVSRGQRMRFYFGEAFRGRGTGNNGGMSCFTVRLHYRGENARVERQNSYLAHRFAPWLYFSSRAKDFPMNAQQYYQFKLRNRNPKAYIENRNIRATTTYYTVNRCGKQIRITYWWYYGYQRACVNLKFLKLKFKKGHHRGDWEKTHVILSWDQQHIIAVAYEQHSGQLTKLASGVRYRSGRPIIYVGDLAHGSYADDKIRTSHRFHRCQYFGDHRKPNSRTKFDSRRKLIPIRPYEAGSETWQKDLGFCKSYQCEVSTTPHEYEMFHGAGHKKFCVGYRACDEAGCEESECLPGMHRQQIPITGTRPRCCKKCGWWKIKVPCKCRKRNWVIPHNNFARGRRVPPYRPPRRPRSRRRAKPCWANGVLKLAQDESGNPIPMKDVPATKEEIAEMQVVKPDAETDKLMTVADGSIGGWRQIGGKLTNVAVSSLGSIYGVNRHNHVWAKRAWNRGRWIRLRGLLTQISVNTEGTIVTGVNRHHYVYYTRVNVNRLGAIRWVNTPGRLVDVSSGAVFRYGVNTHDYIYRAGLTGRSWCRLPGRLKQISAHGRKVVGVSRRGRVYQYIGHGRWKYIRAPRARWASMGRDGEFWVIAHNQAIYRMAGGRWRRIGGWLVQIDVADRNNIIGVNRHENIFAFVRRRQPRNQCSRPRRCKFPFRYRGVLYRACSTHAYKNNFWCSHDSVYRGRWSRCGNCKTSLRASCSVCNRNQRIVVTYSFPSNAGINWRSGWIGLVPRGVSSRWERPNDARDVSWFRIGRARGRGVLRARRRGHYDIKAFTSDHPSGVQVGANVRVFVR